MKTDGVFKDIGNFFGKTIKTIDKTIHAAVNTGTQFFNQVKSDPLGVIL